MPCSQCVDGVGMSALKYLAGMRPCVVLLPGPNALD